MKIEGKTWDKQPWTHQNERRRRKKEVPRGRSRGSPAAPGGDHGGPWEKCEEEGVRYWSSYGLTPTPPFLLILCHRSRRSWRERSWEWRSDVESTKKAYWEGGVLFFKSVFIIVFVSYHSFQLLKHYINFPWVKSVLPVTVTGGQFSWPHLNPRAFS